VDAAVVENQGEGREMKSAVEFGAGFLTGIAIMAGVGLLALATGSTALLAGIVPLGIAVTTAYAVGGLIREALAREALRNDSPASHHHSTAH
jgi:hypothetical protein